MNKKNILTAAVSLSLVACLSIGATLAYFTDIHTKTNVFTTGEVDIILNDFSPEVDGMVSGDHYINDETSGIRYENVVPGDELSKDVSITVMHDTVPTRLAVLVTADIEIPTKPTAEELLQLVDQAMVQQGDFEIATTYYAQTFGDKTGTLYIMDGVVDRSTTNQQIQLFKSLQIPAETWNNEYADAAFDIEVTAYAAQADNLSAEDFETMVLEQAKGLADNFENYGFN